MNVSIIIVNWNTCKLLKDCMQSVYDQTKTIDFEVIVIDNASTDGSAEMVKRDFSNAVLIENTENRGFAAANNQGIKIAKGKYILLLNSDTVALDNAIQKTYDFAHMHPEAAVVGCRVVNPDMSMQPTCFMYPSVLNMLLAASYLYKIFPKSRFFARERMGWWDRSDQREVDVVTGCFMLVRKDAVERIGLMDESYFVYGEETDWCYRFKKDGWKIIFTPLAQIIHFGGQSSKQSAGKMSLQLRGSLLLFMKKHYSKLSYFAACVLTWLFWMVRVPYWALMYAIKRTNYEKSRLLIYLKGMKVLMFQGAEKLCVTMGKENNAGK